LATDPTKVNLASLNQGTIADAVPDLQVAGPKATNPQQRNLMIAQLLSQSRLPDLQAQGNKLMIEALTKGDNPANSMLGKVAPDKFTPASLAKWMKTQDYNDLVPREKIVGDKLGDKIQYRGEYSTNPLGTAAIGISPDTTARLDNTNYWNQNLSANQQQSLGIDRARLANQGIETQFNTGQGVGSPMMAGIPQNAPMQFTQTGGGTPAPQMPANARQSPPAPVNARQPMTPGINPAASQPQLSGQPTLPPRVLADIAAASAKQKNEMANKREFNMGGLNSSLDEAERILTGQTGKLPTSSWVGNTVDSLASIVGAAPAGAAEADQLRSIGGALVAKMPRMEGPQSDKDVQLYREMAGQVGDATLPLSRRLAALKTVRDLYGKYEGNQVGIAGAPPLTGITERRQQPRSNSNRVVVDY
jgi:hypothetical protein